MKFRLSKLSTDVTTQRFWRDNNARFTRDLHSWQQQHEGQEVASEDPPFSADNKALAKRDHDRELIAGLSSESDFYATWLRANAKRNRAYNILVWRQAFDQVRQGARVSVLQAWLSLLRRIN
jgi:nicotinamidase-related amidase